MNKLKASGVHINFTCFVKDSGWMGNFVRNRVIFHMLSTLIHTLKNLSILNALPLFSACIEFGQNVVETFSCELCLFSLTNKRRARQGLASL